MISIVPVGVLAEAQDRGVDVDALKLIDKSRLKPVFDASNNAMKFFGAVYIDVELEGGEKETVAFHISSGPEDELLIGTNALKKLGVEVKVAKRTEKQKAVELLEDVGQRVAVARRVYIPPYDSALVEVQCKGESENVADRVIWPSKSGFASGVFKVVQQQTQLPVFNSSDEPMILKEGEDIGHWGTDKWHENVEEVSQLKWDGDDTGMTEDERREKLFELISRNAEPNILEYEIKEILEQFAGSFAVSDKELTQTDLVKMTINTGNSPPVKLKARPVPLGVRQKLKELLADLLKRNIIEKSSSEWAFPIVLVEKKDGSIRLCVDYRELNKRIKLDAYPLPSIEALLQSLGGKRFFSTLDLCSGYWQIPLADDAKEKSAFTTPEGLFQFRVTPFGLSTSPPVFQRLMDTVLGDLLGKEVFCYIDDIMVCTETKERHLELLKEVFSRIQKAGLRLKAQKCILLRE
ncbi:reverse transcriptase, partial [Ancylostoma caninum]